MAPTGGPRAVEDQLFSWKLTSTSPGRNCPVRMKRHVFSPTCSALPSPEPIETPLPPKPESRNSLPSIVAMSSVVPGTGRNWTSMNVRPTAMPAETSTVVPACVPVAGCPV